jgi:hypothetical protein
MFSASREKMTFWRRPFSIGSFVEVLKPQPSSRLAIFPTMIMTASESRQSVQWTIGRTRRSALRWKGAA